ncbi:MAG: RagB/SusD family nutrient uptake outer membrane protein, partial [Chryseobacterium sp.]|nr:RagB/SusD family nutrient uptake outer membrane protein [Chryseobacterium sp.]
ALFKSGNTALALTELNNFALSRGAQAYTAVSLENILNERRKEFFAEGHRFFDLKRNNLGFAKVTNCYSIVCEVAPNDKLFVIPMSLRERNINLNMTQYPGW